MDRRFRTSSSWFLAHLSILEMSIWHFDREDSAYNNLLDWPDFQITTRRRHRDALPRWYDNVSPSDMRWMQANKRKNKIEFVSCSGNNTTKCWIWPTWRRPRKWKHCVHLIAPKMTHRRDAAMLFRLVRATYSDETIPDSHVSLAVALALSMWCKIPTTHEIRFEKKRKKENENKNIPNFEAHSGDNA